MAVKIKLKRLGKIREPHYRIIVADAHTKRDGRAIEELGKYHPKEEPSFIDVNSERVQYWLGVGAQPTEPVRSILQVTGDWQLFKGQPGAEGTLRAAEPKPDKRALFEVASKEAMAESEAATSKGKKKSQPKAGDAKKADDRAKKSETAAAPGEPAEAGEASESTSGA